LLPNGHPEFAIMIARPVHRPLPIPFDAPSPAASGTQTRAVSWAAALGPGAPTPAIPHLPARLSPVKSPLPAAPIPFSAPQGARRLGQIAPSSHPTGRPATQSPSADSMADVGGPRHHKAHGHAMTEISARYVGHGALSVRSSVTGRHYRFQGHGDSLVIDRNDVVLLKRISDLVIR
jgi:hypothetical protein